MVQAHPNPFNVLESLPSIFGTAATPNYCLCFNARRDHWSAFDLDNPEDVAGVAVDPDWFAVTIIPPEQLMDCLAHPAPNLIADALREFAVGSRPPATQLTLSMFFPTEDETNESTKEAIN